MKTSTHCRPHWATLIATLAIFAVAPLQAATFYVSPGGSDASDGLSWPSAKKTVQAGLDAAAAGDQVWVAAGTYIQCITLKDGVALYGGFAGNETDLSQRNWTTNPTVLDGNRVGRVVTAPVGATTTTRIDGFTIRNDGASSGGVYCSYSSPTISNNVITRNNTGIACYSSSSPVIANNTFVSNNTGIYCASSSPAITNNTIANGRSTAIYCSASSPTITNTIIAFNASGIYRTGSGTPSLRSNCVYGNAGYNYSGLVDPTGTNGNISADPKMVALRYGNCHIQADSPCVDAGEDSAVQTGWVDMDGQSRVHGNHVDMGADESDGTVWPAGPNIIVRVAADGNDGNDGSSWALAKRTVQAGIDSVASLGGDVWVKAGTYSESIMLREYCHVYGGFAGGETDRDARDWAHNTTTITAVTGAGFAGVSTVDGFTIRGGQVWCVLSSPIIANNVITGWSSRGPTSSTGAIYCETSWATITNNTVTGNSAMGIYCRNASPTITNNVISANSYCGIYCESSRPTIANNRIVGNSTGVSGSGSSYPTITNNTIIGNMDYGIFACEKVTNTIVAFNGVGIVGADVSTCRYNCVYGNLRGNYYQTADFTGTNGNISVDPQLAQIPYANVHIQPDSPCIDAGDDSAVQAAWTDMDGQPRKQGAHVDIGADESDGTVWPVVPPAIVRVNPQGDDTNDGSSWALAKRTVQAAVNATAPTGGQVWVATGTYVEQIVLPMAVSLFGGFAGNETDLSQRNWISNQTILDGGRAGSVVTASPLLTPAERIDGFTIRNGGPGQMFGGVCCNNASPTIANNTITGNACSGICCKEISSPVITNNVIRGNGSFGIYCWFSSPTITNNQIAGNSGTGIVDYGTLTTITNNTITGNGGGISCCNGPPTITNTIVAFNASGIFALSETPTLLRHNCVYGNTAYNYSGLTDPTGTSGNLRADPQFVRQASPGPDAKWGTADDDYGDLHLLPGSPCIDAGNNADVPAEPLPFDLAGLARFANDPATADTGAGTAPIVDMGAYEYHPADITADGHVDAADLLALASSWGKAAGQAGFDPRCDLNHDGSVDIVDLLYLADCWGI